MVPSHHGSDPVTRQRFIPVQKGREVHGESRKPRAAKRETMTATVGNSKTERRSPHSDIWEFER
jgi:hypothetical protein